MHTFVCKVLYILLSELLYSRLVTTVLYSISHIVPPSKRTRAGFQSIAAAAVVVAALPLRLIGV